MLGMRLRRAAMLLTSLALAVPVAMAAVPAASAAEGDLDTAFSGDGIVPFDISWGFGFGDPRDLVSGPAGSVYVIGGNGGAGCIGRFTAAGVVDTTFNATAPGRWCNSVNGAAVAGASTASGDVVAAMRPVGKRTLVRLSATGSLTYLTDLTGDLGGSGAILGVAALDDGRSVLLETTDASSPGRVIAFSAAGVDSAPWTVPQPAGRTFLPDQVLVGPAGKLILVGPSTDGAGDDRMTALRVSTAGVPDTTFSTDGFVLGPTAFIATGGAAALLSGGDLLLAALQTGTVRFARLSAAGTPVASFGDGGQGSWTAPATTELLGSLVARPDGRFFVVYGRTAAGSGTTVVTERRRADGSLDPLYSGDGLATWESGAVAPGNRTEAVGALGPKGDLYVHADNTNGFEEIVRFDGTDNAAPTRFAVTGGTVPWSLTRSFALGFAASDPSGVAFDVRLARGTGTTGLSAYPPATTSSARSRTVTLVAGETACASVRARDTWGNLTAAAPARCVAAPLTASALTKRGFSLVTGRRTYASKVLTTTRSGATAGTRTIRARQLALVVSTCPTCGAATVSFGGRILTVVDLRGRARTRVVLPVTTFPQTRVGAVTIKVITSGKRVTIEGIGVLTGPAPFVTR